MARLECSSDLSAVSIERYRLVVLAAGRSSHATHRDVTTLHRCATRLHIKTLPIVYQESFSRLRLPQTCLGPLATDLLALIRRAGDEKPQAALSRSNIGAEIGSWGPGVLSKGRINKRRFYLRLLSHDLVEVDFNHDIGSMVMPDCFEPELEKFFGHPVNGILRYTWKPYLVFLKARSAEFSVSEELLDEFRTWLRQRRWPEAPVSLTIGKLHRSVRKANRQQTLGPNGKHPYRDEEAGLTVRMRAFLNRLRTRANGKDPEAIRARPRRFSTALIAFCQTCHKADLEPVVTVKTVEIFRKRLLLERVSPKALNASLNVLRRYCRETGEGFDWLQADANDRRHPPNGSIRMPQSVRRKFDLFAKHARIGRFHIPDQTLRSIELILGKMFRFCRATGRSEDLSDDTVTAYFVALEDKVKASTVRCTKFHLRRFLRKADPQNAWFLSGQPAFRSRRPAPRVRLEQIILPKHWDHLRGRILSAKDGRIDLAAIQRLDPVVSYASNHRVVAPAQVLALAGSDRVGLLGMIKMLQIIDPRSALIFPIREALGLTYRKTSNIDPIADAIAVRYDTILAKCPNPLRDRLIPMTSRDLRGNRAISINTLARLSRMARELESVTHEKALAPFTTEVFTAAIVVLADSDLRSSTIVNRLQDMLRIIDILGLSSETREAVSRYVRPFKSSARQKGKRKASRLSSHPLTIEDVAMAASRARREALDTITHVDSVRSRMGAAAAIAIWTALPLRISDMRRLVLGVSLIRHAGAWHVSLLGSKTGEMIDRTLPDQVTPHIDLLVMHGSEVVMGPQFQSAYTMQEGLPLLRNRYGTVLTSQSIRKFTMRYISVTPHIIRTLLRDRLAIHGQEGNDVSRQQLGHRSQASGLHYEVFADDVRAAEADRMLHQGIRKAHRS